VVDLKGEQFFDARSALHEAAGVEPKQNGLRHSFASYHLAKIKDANETAQIMGHTNVNLTHDHYKQIAREKDVERYWSLRPAESKRVISIAAA
jgi:integrase